MNTIAQILFDAQPAFNFAHIVSELDGVLSRYPAERRALNWDCDDVAVFDLDGSRVVLGYRDDLDGGHAACLTVSVGHGAATGAATHLARRHDMLCRRILDRFSVRYAFDHVIWHSSDLPVTAEMIDLLLDTLPGEDGSAPPSSPEADGPVEIDRLMARMSAELDGRLTQRDRATQKRREKPRTFIGHRPGPVPKARALPPPAASAGAFAAASQPAATLAAHTGRRKAQANDDANAALRRALYPPADPARTGDDDLPSTQMRLAVHAMNATMVAVFLPVGAAVMTYSFLRGEDLRISARALVLTGTAIALGQSHIGHQMLALI